MVYCCFYFSMKSSNLQGIVLVEKTPMSEQYFPAIQKFTVLDLGMALLPVASQMEASGIIIQFVSTDSYSSLRALSWGLSTDLRGSFSSCPGSLWFLPESINAIQSFWEALKNLFEEFVQKLPLQPAELDRYFRQLFNKANTLETGSGTPRLWWLRHSSFCIDAGEKVLQQLLCLIPTYLLSISIQRARLLFLNLVEDYSTWLCIRILRRNFSK